LQKTTVAARDTNKPVTAADRDFVLTRAYQDITQISTFRQGSAHLQLHRRTGRL
jgi:hypothetical protein